jgi:hypothetical protein
MLVQGSGNYRTGFAADAVGYALAAVIVIAVGRALAPHKSKHLDTAVSI